MPASKEFRIATLGMLRSMMVNQNYKIEKKVKRLQIGLGVKETRYSVLSRDKKTIWSIRSVDPVTGSHPISVCIDGKSLWGEFLDSEVESLYKDMKREYKRRYKEVEKEENPKEIKTSLGQEKEKQILSFLKRRAK